jgi:uncharacterized protein (TIGR02117 family)
MACSTPARQDVLGPRPPVATPSASSPRSVWVIGHGWHVGVALARADVAPTIWPERDDLGPFAFLEVGWGDGDYYRAGRGTVGLALKAVFRSTATVLRVAAFDAHPARYFDAADVVELPVSDRGLDDLSRFIAGYYERDDAGRGLPLGPGLYGSSGFYRARGQYRVFDNSNHWTARALQAAGVAIDPDRALTAGQVLSQARRLRGR